MRSGFRVSERFDPRHSDAWSSYIAWSGLTHLEEVVGLDCSLCPSAITTLLAEDWDHLVFPEHIFACFDTPEYAMRRLGADFDGARLQLLALAREPGILDVTGATPSGFAFQGYDLIEEATATSALTKCGGFVGAFEATDLSANGLIASASRAHEIREALATLYPEENHADCAVWAIWRRGTV